MLGKTKKERVKEVCGACVSMGVTVDGKDPKTVIKEIAAGSYSSLF
jgi:large subunit ribosomal protein L11